MKSFRKNKKDYGTKPSLKWIIFFVIPFGLIFISYGLYSIQFTSVKNGWKVARGEVVRVNSSLNRGYDTKVIVEYWVGTEKFVARNNFRVHHSSANNLRTVVYNPNNSKESYVLQSGDTTPAVILFFGVFVIVFAITKYLTFKYKASAKISKAQSTS